MARQTPTPTRKSQLTLREITEDNWRAVANLRPFSHQEGNLASNVWSIAEAHYSEDAWMRAIYADDTLVGFLMMAIWDPKEAYYIWRFMIDQRYQGLGFGTRVVGMAAAHIRQHNPKAKTLGLMSTPQEGCKGVTPEDSPYNYYVKLGFKQVAPPDEDGEVEMAVDLATSPLGREM